MHTSQRGNVLLVGADGALAVAAEVGESSGPRRDIVEVVCSAVFKVAVDHHLLLRQLFRFYRRRLL